MKITFTENEYNSNFNIEPETADEVAQLFRMVNNSKAEKPEMYLSFGSNDKTKIWCCVSINKLKPASNKVINSIKNY